MKKIFKSRLFLIILTVIITTSIIGVSASILYQASEIGFTPKNKNWKVNNLESALNDLYENKGTSATKFCTFVTSEYGDSSNHLSVGSKYSCDPGDGTKRNFFVLAVDNNKVKLIMEHNITEGSGTTTMTWMDAIKYIDNNNLQTIWSNVLDISLPNVQDIANAVGNTSWKMENKEKTDWFCFGTGYNQQCAANSGALKNDTQTLKYRWLFNYTKECENSGCLESTSLSGNEANGYWTQNLIKNDGTQAWRVYRDSAIRNYDISNDQTTGVRPVITVLKDNLQG